MENKIIARRRQLEADLQKVRYQLDNLTQFYSADQIKVWRRQRRSILRQLRLLPSEAEIYAAAKNTTSLVKSILKRL